MGCEEQIVDVLQKALGVDVRRLGVGRVLTVISKDGTSRILDATGAAPAGVYPNYLLDELIRVMQNPTFESEQFINVVKAHCRLRECPKKFRLCVLSSGQSLLKEKIGSGWNFCPITGNKLTGEARQNKLANDLLDCIMSAHQKKVTVHHDHWPMMAANKLLVLYSPMTDMQLIGVLANIANYNVRTICLAPVLSLPQLAAVARNTMHGMSLNLHPQMTHEQLKVVVINAKAGVLLEFGFLSQDRMEVVATNASPGVILFLHSNMTDEQLRLVAKNAKSGVALYLHAHMACEQLRLVAKNASYGVNLTLYHSLSEAQIKVVAENVKSGVALYLHADMTCEQLRLVAKNASYGINLILHHSLSEAQLEVVAMNTKPGVVLDLHSGMTHEQLSVVAMNARSSVILNLRPGLSDTHLEAVAENASRVLLYLHHGAGLKVVAKNANPGVYLILDRWVRGVDLKVRPVNVKPGVRLMLSPSLSSDEIKIVAQNVNPGVRILLSSYFSNHQLQSLAKNISSGVVLDSRNLTEAQRNVLENNARVDVNDAGKARELNPSSSQGLSSGPSDDVQEVVITSNAVGNGIEKRSFPSSSQESASSSCSRMRGSNGGGRLEKRRKIGRIVGEKPTLFNSLIALDSSASLSQSDDSASDDVWIEGFKFTSSSK